MSAFTEFVLVAVALFLWESTLWLPLRGVALRRRWFDHRWKILSPGSLIATRELGMIAMLPLPPDGGLAPCQAPPLLVTDDGTFLMESGAGVLHQVNPVTWSELKDQEHHLVVNGVKTRISSPRCLDGLRRAKRRGETPEAAVRQAWRRALSPSRAGREWRRWRLVSAPLRWSGPILTLVAFIGLPVVFVHLGSAPTLILALWLWIVMIFTASQLWWLGSRVYPGARSALRMDAALALLVPFHAMRALEIAAVHAMGTTHPCGLMLSSGDLANPWLGRFVRRILHPRPGVVEDAVFASALESSMAAALSRCGKMPGDYDGAPDRSTDLEAAAYCPRCHGLFLAQVEFCHDCRGLELRRFP